MVAHCNWMVVMCNHVLDIRGKCLIGSNLQFRFKISHTSQIVCVSLGQNEQYRPIASKIIQYNTNMRSIWNERRTVF